MKSTKERFFEDLAAATDWWIASTCDLLVDPEADDTAVSNSESFRRIARALVREGVPRTDLEKALAESMRGLAMSFLTILDGGTKLAETGRVRLIDDTTKKAVGEGLHEQFIGYLMDSGRVRPTEFLPDGNSSN